MKQTAVEWFLTEFQKQVWFEPNSELDIWIKDLIPKAKEMEKEQRGYSEEDVIKIVEKSRETGLTAEYLLLTFKSE